MSNTRRMAPEEQKQWLTLVELRNRLMSEIEALGSQYAVAQKYGVNSAHVYRVVDLGQESPTLRMAMGTPKSKPRTRLCIDTSKENIEQFDDFCKSEMMTRHEVLSRLLWIAEKLF